MFAYGNLSESPFKDLNANEAVGPIYPATVTRNRGIGIPLLPQDARLGASDLQPRQGTAT
jgi:hypothetical protein